MKKRMITCISLFLVLLMTGCVKYDSTANLEINGEPLTIKSMQKMETFFDDHGNYVHYKIKYKNQTLVSKAGIGEINGTMMLRYKFDVIEIYSNDDVGLYTITLPYQNEKTGSRNDRRLVANIAINKQKNKHKLYKYVDETKELFQKLDISEENIALMQQARDIFHKKNTLEREQIRESQKAKTAS